MGSCLLAFELFEWSWVVHIFQIFSLVLFSLILALEKIH